MEMSDMGVPDALPGSAGQKPDTGTCFIKITSAFSRISGISDTLLPR